MPTPSTGVITLLDIATEFGGTAPYSLGNYYAGGAFVPAGTKDKNGVAIPSSGPISLGMFYGASKYVAPIVNNPLSPVPAATSRGWLNAVAQAYFSVYASTWGADGLDASNSGTWLTGGNAADVEILITPTSGTFSSNTAATWVAAVNATATVTSSSSVRVKTCTFTVQFRDKTTLAILSTTTGCTIRAETSASSQP